MPRLAYPDWTFALCAALSAFALAAFSPAIFHDGDTYWHIRAGEWMLNHRAVLHRDVFSYTAAGAPWDAAEWLAEMVMALAWRLAGWAGLHLLFGIAAALAAAIVAGALRTRMAMTAALLTTVLGLACVTGSLLARPHLLALPLLALWTTELVKARERQRAPRWWLLAVMPLWANLHGSFAFGLVLAAALGLEAALETKMRGPDVWRWGAFLLAASACALLTPAGIDGLLFPLRLNAMRGLGYLGEWRPSDFSTISPFEIALLATVAVLASGKVKVPWFRVLILLGIMHMALAHGRHQMIFGVAAPLLLAPYLGKAWPTARETGRPLLAAAVCAALLGLFAARLMLPVTRSDDGVSPVAALAHVTRWERAQPVLNDYAFGGYLIWKGIKPFIDSRADLYGDAFLSNYAAIVSPDKQALSSTLARRHVRWTVFSARAPVVKLMDAMPGWHRLYGDAIAVVHVRD
jgi:hypothetical protein